MNKIDKPRPGVGVGILVLKEGKLLLGKRNDDAEKASSELSGEGTWTMPGGKLHFQESFEEAAIREVKEETDIDIKKEELKLISITNDKTEKAHFVTIGFLTETNQDPKAMEPEEITEWKFFELDNLPEKIFKPSEKVLKNYLDKQIYKN